MATNLHRAWLLAALLACEGARAAQPTVAPNPSLPMYGQPVVAQLQNADWPVYIPLSRYSVSGSTINVDFEYVVDGFGPSRPDFGYVGVPLGELVPGNYTLVARLIDIAKPDAAPQIVSSGFAVVPPDAWGAYLVPKEQLAQESFSVLIRSAVYFNPASLRYSITGNTIRVDFDYYANSPAWGAGPPGATTFAAVAIPGRSPGSYTVEAWGKSDATHVSEKYFTITAAVATPSPVIEYYAERLDHYFISAGPDEISALDAGRQPGWKRTGQRFKAWLTNAQAPAGAVPVCRFYAAGPNSHFYTASASECQYLKTLEAQQRSEAAAAGRSFVGWGYETIAFWALAPQGGQCPAESEPVYRAYNKRATQMDSNHRFMDDPQIRYAMTLSWADEGIAFCAPR